MVIDPDANALELAQSWVSGNHNDVIHQLKTDHPGLTAAVIVQGTHDRILTAADCNTITNMLIDDRVEQYRNEEDVVNVAMLTTRNSQ